jgi:small subunit ribosomal protein S17
MTNFANRLGRFLPINLQNGSRCRIVMNPTLQNTVRLFNANHATPTTTSQWFRPNIPTTLQVVSTSLKQYLQSRHQLSLQLFRNFSSQQQMMSSSTPTTESNMVIVDDEPFPNIPISEMSNEELADTSTIHGWDLIHSPPKKLPRGALIGTVVSDKMNKTINVAVVRYRIVPKVRKRIRYTRKFMAHDEKEVANMGDVVLITPSHRISKNKHFMLREIVRPKGQL